MLYLLRKMESIICTIIGVKRSLIAGTSISGHDFDMLGDSGFDDLICKNCGFISEGN